MTAVQSLDLNIPKEDLNSAIVQELRHLGLKHGTIPKRLNKASQNSKTAASQGYVFHKPLQLMSSRIVQLQSGVDAEVPNFLQEMCSCIAQQADMEGLFRKGGSAARQKEIRARLDSCLSVDLSQHHVIDVANILKFFLRELPEPVLPYAYHDLFLHCLLLEDTIGAVLLVCLLLPRPHLHVLAYLIEFFHLISTLSESNKMTGSNLAIVITPSLMPISEKMSLVQNPHRLNAHVRIVEILISNAERIAVLPDGVVGKLSLTPSVSNLSLENDDHINGTTFPMKKRGRRSGSLTRMFNGLKKKIVGGKGSLGAEAELSGTEEEIALVPPSADILTPCVKAGKKRKALDSSSAFSSKKKKDVLRSLPQSTALANTPFKKSSAAIVSEPNATPSVCPHPNPSTSQKRKSKSPPKTKHHKLFGSRTYSESDSRSIGSTSKKAFSGVSNFVIKKKHRGERHSTSGNFLERSWSAVSSNNWGRKKSRRSDQDDLSVLSTSAACILAESDLSRDDDIGIDLSQEDPFDSSSSEFVKLPKSEYEDLKSRMTAIESCISQEFSSVSTSETKTSPGTLNAADTVLAVQTAYEKTLEDADIAKDASADQLAKRLSRELKIRHSSESKVIRSPSARKIGSLRRKSRERQSPSLRRELRRNKSWHMMHRPANVSMSLSSVEVPSAHISRLRRGRPNTVFSGLPQPTPNRAVKEIKLDVKVPILGVDTSPRSMASPVTRGQARRASSFHSSEISSPALPSSKKCKSQVNIAKAALLAHAQQKSKYNFQNDEKWHDAQELLNSSRDILNNAPVTGRESIAKLRCQNAGKVLATARLFNGSTESPKPAEIRRSRTHQTITPLPSEETEVQDKHKNLNNGTGDKVMENVTEMKRNLVDTVGPVARVSPRNISNSMKRTIGKETSPQSPYCRKIKVKSSLHQPPGFRDSCKLKKHSSLKTDRAIHSQPVKRNLSVPVQLIDCGKENQIVKSGSKAPQISRNLSPKVAKDSVSVTDCIPRVSISPLKDYNRIDSNQQVQKFSQGTQCTTPSIKQPLTVVTPRRKAFTPQSHRSCSGNTPLKVLTTSVASQSAQQQPSRLQCHTKVSRKLGRSFNQV